MLHTDTQLLTLLKDDSEEGLAALIGEYSGFLWAVSGRYLDNGEDIKDCLNETFSDFYLHLDRFDPDKGSLKGYLAVICQRNALRRGRDNLRWAGVQPSELKADSEPLERWEQTETLDEALSSLDPVDEQIVRMKYYGGMTAREIAASLGLPRETVYKRQQRSLSKMKKFLIAGLILALLGALAACAYVVLRYFGFVPGYGVNTDETAPFSILEESVTTRNGQCSIELEKALLTNGELELLLSVRREDESWNPGNGVWYDSYATNQSLLAGDAPCQLTSHASYPEETAQVSQQPMTREEIEALMAGGGPPPQSAAPEEVMVQLTYAVPGDWTDEELTLTLYGQELVFRVSPALEHTLEGRFWAMGDLGGLLAEPRLEDGRLLVELYDLENSEFSLSVREATLRAEAGALLPGQPVPGASGQRPYAVFDFGPVQPGNYTLEIPYLNLTADLTQPISIPLAPLDGSFQEEAYSIPGGALAVTGWTDGPPDPRIPVMPANPGEQAAYLRLDLRPGRDDLIPVGLGLGLGRIDGAPLPMSTATAIFDSLPDGGRILWGLRLSWPEGVAPVELALQSGPYDSNISYRWNCAISIPITVSE